MSRIEEILTISPVIPVIVIDDINDAVPLAQALVNGGLRVLEVTLRSEVALAAISRIIQAVPEAIVGAGTVLCMEDLSKAIAAGSRFLVSPGSTATLVDAALQQSIPFLPGVATASEAMNLLEKGFSHLKFFPAQAAGGIPMLKSLHGPLPHLKFCPTGGITELIAPDYLALDNVLCVGGSWMLDKTAIAAQNWDSIEAKARTAALL
jgi:2-dehydro-3-deoxyphosphogluconate aldolase/(4S)-4-hydroxy-2-oxoglutarate aldolase